MEGDKKYRQNLIVSIFALTLAILTVGTFYVRDLLEGPKWPSAKYEKHTLPPREINDPPAVHREVKETVPEPEQKGIIPKDTMDVPAKSAAPVKKMEALKSPAEAGNGKLTLYMTCSGCEEVSVFIDGTPAGTLLKPYNEKIPPACGAEGTLSRTLKAGRYHISARDRTGRSSDLMLTVVAGKCKLQEIVLEP